MSLIKKFFKENLKTNEVFEKTEKEQPKKETQIENVNMQVEERTNNEQTTNSVIDEVKSYIKSNAALFKVESEFEYSIWFDYVINPQITIGIFAIPNTDRIRITTMGGIIPKDRLIEFIVKNKNYWISVANDTWFYQSEMTNFCSDDDFDMEKLKNEIIFHIRYAEITNSKIYNWINNNAELELQ